MPGEMPAQLAQLSLSPSKKQKHCRVLEGTVGAVVWRHQTASIILAAWEIVSSLESAKPGGLWTKEMRWFELQSASSAC